ncbi:hypothetical protein MMC25_008327 [Agyrium rufum]|nr:hypothetical protein [Agyrium rufum]
MLCRNIIVLAIWAFPVTYARVLHRTREVPDINYPIEDPPGLSRKDASDVEDSFENLTDLAKRTHQTGGENKDTVNNLVALVQCKATDVIDTEDAPNSLIDLFKRNASGSKDTIGSLVKSENHDATDQSVVSGSLDNLIVATKGSILHHSPEFISKQPSEELQQRGVKRTSS